MSRRTIGLTAALAAVIALAVCITLATGHQTEASSLDAGEPVGVSELQVATVMGDVDCSGSFNPVSPIDALKLLRYTIHLAVTQNEPCPDIGTGGPPAMGDVDCDSDVDVVDSLKVLRFVGGDSVFQNEPCPDIGT